MFRFAGPLLTDVYKYSSSCLSVKVFHEYPHTYSRLGLDASLVLALLAVLVSFIENRAGILVN